jgi:hypothetical protein
VLAGICGHLREFAPTSRGMCAGCDRCLPCKPQCLRMARSRRGGLEALIDRQADRARGLVKTRVVLPGDGFSSTIPLASREQHGFFHRSDARPSPTFAPRDRDPALTRVVPA